MTAAVEQVLARWDAAREPLTPVDVETLGWLVVGLSVREMAVQAGLPVSTVRSRLRRLYARLGVRTGAAAVAAAIRAGALGGPR